jgi:hypothetical protein
MDQSDETQGSVTEHEHKLYAARSRVFAKYTSELLAEDLAWRLLLRDRDPADDRRICLACAHLKDDYCNERRASKVKGFQPCKTVLWRCDFFKQKG